MRPYDIIMKKRNGEILSREEIYHVVLEYTKGSIPDYQMSAFMMAVYFSGMNDEETTNLTMAMVESGETVDLSPIPGVKVDKHSTGGVGDTTTLILAPLVAAAGVPVAKMSGRGLGHTGGTLDKLESIPGLTVSISHEEFIEQVKRIGVAVIGQTANLAPADKKMYALRDVTATIDSIPLIAGSIMSKKIAAGTDAILLDVKSGSGAFMPTIDMARELASRMVGIGKGVGRRVAAIITDMDQPLGTMIGNALEVREAVEILKGLHPGSALREVSVTLGSHLLVMGNAAKTLPEGRKIIEKKITDGSGALKFKEMIKAQKGDPHIVDDVKLLPQAKIKVDVKAGSSGYVSNIQAQQVGLAAMVLGAGRQKKEDTIDMAVGLILKKRVGETVEKGESFAEIYANDESKIKESERLLVKSFKFSSEPPEVPPLILDTISD
ncbi:MAG: pyrimidine-nucleoside phosphorylase [Firmicutes bacterium]|nr:pyrimidine-nucleoside phosphorylase [Bacillota bacterium]